MSDRRAVLVVPEIPTPPRCGNAWRDLQQIHVLRRLGFTVEVVAAIPRWDLTEAEEVTARDALCATVAYLDPARQRAEESGLATLARKLGYLLASRTHPFGWWLPGGLSPLIASLAGDAGDVLLMRSIFVHEIPALRRVWPGCILVDCHDADVHLADELLATTRGMARLGPWANRVGVQRAIARYLPLADEAWAVSREDAARLARDAPRARVIVVPSGMDAGSAAPAATPGIDGTALIVANFGYGPNARGVEWLVRSVWPLLRTRLPSARLVCVGGRMPARLVALCAATPGIETRGLVADIGALQRDAAMILVPLLEGSGTRVKIVEAWSRGKAVVTTPKGIEGLPAAAEAVAVGATAEEFATATAALLYDADRRRRLGARALHLVRERLSWDVATRSVGFGSIIVDAGALQSDVIP